MLDEDEQIDQADALTAHEAARLIGVHPSTIRRWAKSGRLRESAGAPGQPRRYVREGVLACKHESAPVGLATFPADMPPRFTIPIDSALAQLSSDLTKSSFQVPAQARLAEQMHESIKAANLTEGIRDVMKVVNSSAYRQAQELIVSPIYRQALNSATIAASQQALIRSVLPATQELRTLLNDIVPSIQPAFQALARSYASSRFPVPEISETLRLMVRDQQRLSEVLRDTLKHTPPTLLGPLAQGILPLQGAATTLAEMMEDTATPRIALTQAQLAIKAHQEFGIERLKSMVVARHGGGARAADLLAFGAVGPVLGVSMDALAGLAHHTSLPGSTALKATEPSVYRWLETELDERRDELAPLSVERVESELQQSLALQISRTARRIIDARAACGRAALLLGGEAIFKATVETEYASAMLPQYVVEDEESFGTFIDWLYKYVYESSGQYSRLRPLLSQDQLEAALAVKYLRHHYRHDPDHGDATSIRKKYARVKGILIDLAGVPILTVPAQWQQAQLSLLCLVERVLQQVNEALARCGS